MRHPTPQLGDLILSAQSRFATSARVENGVIQLRMNNVDTGGQFGWESYIRVPHSVGWEAYNLEPGDVLFNNTNSAALVWKTAVFEGLDEPVTYSNHFSRIRTNQDLLLPRYLGYWLR